MTKLCKKCGNSKEAKYRCRSCKKVYDTVRRVKDFEIMSKQKQNWVAANSEHVKSYKVSWYSQNKTRYRQDSYTKRYGITLAEYETLFKEQNGLCAICLQPETRVTYGKVTLLAVDHCHNSGKIRGLLCAGCNTGLGLFKENPKLLDLAKAYLSIK